MRFHLRVGALLALVLMPRAAVASKCTQVGDDDYHLLVLGVVEDKRQLVRERICPISWDVKTKSWYGTSADIKKCLKGEMPLRVNGHTEAVRVDRDPDPRSSHFVFSIANSADQAAWESFGKLVHVQFPSHGGMTPSVVATGAVGSGGILLFELQGQSAAARAAQATLLVRQAAAIAAEKAAILAAESAQATATAAEAAANSWWADRAMVLRGIWASDAGVMPERVAKLRDILDPFVRANFKGLEGIGAKAPSTLEWASNRALLATAGEGVALNAAKKIYLAELKSAARAALQGVRTAGTASEVAIAENAAGVATTVSVESISLLGWPLLAAQLVAWSVGFALDHSCPGKWYDERKKLLDTLYTKGGAITYSFRVNTGPTAADNYVEQVVLAHLGPNIAFFPLMQDRRPLEFRN